MDTKKKPHIRLTPEVSMMLRHMKEVEAELDHQADNTAALVLAIKVATKAFNEDIELLFEHVFEDERRKRMFNY